jgi:methylenetetrahydrofolate reductase (NADPH)
MALTGNRKPIRRATEALLEAPRFELVPLHGVIDQARYLPPGSTVTVTSSPARGIEPTIALAEALAAEGFRAVPHLAARQLRDEAELATIVKRLDQASVRDVFVVGGDTSEPAGNFPDGLSLLEAMHQFGHGFDQVGIPSYPEGHHAIGDDALWSDLAAKGAFATYTVTQLCFDADAICGFAAATAARGIDLPVVIGVPGAVDAAKLLRISLKVGVGESLKFVRGNAAVARRLLRPVGFRPDGLLRKLAVRLRDGGCPISGLHIYTFNQVGQTVGWLHEARRRAAA